MDKTEREFYLALKHFVHRARKIWHMSPPYMAQQISTTQGVYLAYEMGGAILHINYICLCK